MNDVMEKSKILKFFTAAVAISGATATVIIYFYENYRVPLKTLETTIQYSEVGRHNDELKATVESQKLEIADNIKLLSSKSEEIKRAGEKIKAQAVIIKNLHASNLFYPGEFYPAGYGRPRIGDQIEDLKGVFSSEKVAWPDPVDGEGTVEVTLENSFFEKITYTYEEESKIIIGITFDAPRDTDIMFNRLQELGGKPTHSKRDDIYRWYISQKESGYLLDRRTFMILSTGYAPVFWKEPVESVK